MEEKKEKEKVGGGFWVVVSRSCGLGDWSTDGNSYPNPSSKDDEVGGGFPPSCYGAASSSCLLYQ